MSKCPSRTRGRMAIDLRKNKDSLYKAYDDVVSDNSDTNWAIFGYEGLTTTLKTVSTGDGGLEELQDELNSGHIQYAYCRVTDPNTSLPKYVLINWQGEGAQDSFKLKCAAHLRDIEGFLKTIHVMVNARTETDIDEDDIMKKVAKASGANYSFHKEKAKPVEAPAPVTIHVMVNARTETDIDEDDIMKKVAKASGANYSFHKEKAKPVEAPAPVGTDYHRVIPTREINPKNRDKFWAETEKEESLRKAEETRRAQDEKERLEKERRERELQEARERDRRVGEHARQIQEQKEAEQRANALNKLAEKEQWEAASLVGSGTSSAREFFKQKSVERPDADARKAPPPPRKLQPAFSLDQQTPSEPPRREPAQLPRLEPEPEPAYGPLSLPTPQQPAYEAEPAYQREPEPEAAHVAVAEPEAQRPQTHTLLTEGLPPRQDSDEEEEQNWDEPPQEDLTPHQLQQQKEQAPLEPVNGGGHVDQGICARALYDYQAADDTEISFDPDDIITNIDQIDAGWWQGFAPNGSYGMFPANYVELI